MVRLKNLAIIFAFSAPLAIITTLIFSNEIFSNPYSFPNKLTGFPIPIRHHVYQIEQKQYQDTFSTEAVILNFLIWLTLSTLITTLLLYLKSHRKAFIASLSLYLSLFSTALTFFLVREPPFTILKPNQPLPLWGSQGSVRGWPFPYCGDWSTSPIHIEGKVWHWELKFLILDILIWFLIFAIILFVLQSVKNKPKTYHHEN